MAIGNITVKDASGTTKKVSTNVHTTDENAQVAQIGFGADGDAPTLVSSANPLPTAVSAAIPAGDNNIGNMDVASMPTGASAAQIQGTVASGSAQAQNPVMVGGKAVTATPTAVDAADAVVATHDEHGRNVNVACAPKTDWQHGNSGKIENTTATQVLAAAGEGLKWYVKTIMVTNTDASVGTTVTIQDDAGSPVNIWGPQGAAPNYGGFTVNFDGAGIPTTANRKVMAACGTTSAEVYVDVYAYKAP